MKTTRRMNLWLMVVVCCLIALMAGLWFMYGKSTSLIPWQVAFYFIMFLVGSTVTVGGITFQNPWQDKIRNILIEDEYILRRRLESFHAITAVLTVVKEGRGLFEATLTGGSARAANFFGFEGEHLEVGLVGKSGAELMELLEPYMTEENYKEFGADQSMLFKQYSDGSLAIAKVPVVFKEEHKYHGGEAFLPVIVSLGKRVEKGDGKSQRLIQIAYLKVNDLVPAVEYFNKWQEKGD